MMRRWWDGCAYGVLLGVVAGVGELAFVSDYRCAVAVRFFVSEERGGMQRHWWCVSDGWVSLGVARCVVVVWWQISHFAVREDHAK